MIAELLIFTAVVVITSLFFQYKKRVEYFKSFKNRDIPGPEPSILLGNYAELKKADNKNKVINGWIAKYGDVCGYFFGPKRYIIISDLDTINQVFIKNSASFYNREDFALDAKYLIDSVIALKNERWAKVRKILTPIFSYTKVHSGTFDPEMKSCIIELTKAINEKIRENKLVDLKDQKSVELDAYNLMQAFTLDVISRTSFGLEEKVYEPDNHLMHIVKEYFMFAGNIFVEIASLIPFLRNVLTFVNNNLTSGRLVDMMQVRLKAHISQFVKVFQDKPSSDENKSYEEINSKFSHDKAKVLVSLIRRLADKSITEHEFIGNLLLVLLAGYETTANSVTTALYLLAKHPEIQAKLREEVLKDGLDSKYLDMFWHENLRYYPPVSLFVTRKANTDCLVNGIQFLKDDIAQAPVSLVHRNEQYWPEPEVFRPERFDPEERKNHHPCQFLTYGIGQKACLGLNFANYEAKMLIMNVIKEFKLEQCDRTPEPLEFITPTVINNPSKPVFLRFTRL